MIRSHTIRCSLTTVAVLAIQFFLTGASAGDGWDVYTIEQGFTRRPTSAIAAGQGIVYLARSNGAVIKFNGETFREIQGVQEAVSGTQITSLLVENSRIWIGSGKGLFLHHDSGTRNFTSREGLKVNRILDIQVDESKNVWVLGQKKLARGSWYGNRLEWTTFSLWSGWIKQFDAADLLIDTNQRVWVATSKGVLQVSQTGETRLLGPESGLQRVNTTCLAEDGESGLWVGAHDHFGRGTVFRMKDETFQDMGTGFGLPRLKIKALTIDGQVVWAATDKGLYKFDGTRWHKYSRLDGLAQNDIDAVLTTPEGVYVRTVSRYSSELNRLSKIFE